ncbi:MAG TPA: hypothetical protein VE871_06835 [Longimicrobium sp.]|nr:hypothetical protein [Longimicrobium sp.]
MRNQKLRLDLEELSVESFAPSDQAEARGTVHGQETQVMYDCFQSQLGSGCLTRCDASDCTYCNGGTGGNSPVGTLAGATCNAICQPSPVIE